jgi:protein subunit release factor A
MATEELETRIKKAKKDAAAAKKKARRDVAIHDHTVIRTYNYSRGTVLDHRSGKQATIKNVVEKGKIDLLK